MGNTISSIKTVVVNSIKGVFSGYREFADRCFKYYFKCPSYPLVEDIVNNGVILPCQIVVLLPQVIYGVSMIAFEGSIFAYETIKNYPEETVVFLGSHYITVFRAKVPVFSIVYPIVMAYCVVGYYCVRVPITDMYNHTMYTITGQSNYLRNIWLQPGSIIHDEHGNQWMHRHMADVYENMRVREQQQLLSHALWRPAYNNPAVNYH